MAYGVLLLGESGSGKTTAARTLIPAETFIINPTGKALPWKGWKAQYPIFDPKTKTGNMTFKHDAANILAYMNYVSSERKEIKNLYIDDFQYMSSFEFFDRAQEVGYTKFTDIGMKMKNVAVTIKTLREDLMVFIGNHVDDDTDIDGNRKISTKSIGKMVKEKLTFEGLFTTVLYARAKRTEAGIEYGFATRTDGIHPAKTPMGMFEKEFIPNDLALVRKAIIDYE